MSVGKIFVLFSLLTCSAYNIDVITNKVLVRNGKNGSMFGYSIALNDGKTLGGPGVFVGAPLGQTIQNGGDLFHCKIGESSCENVRVDSSIREPNGFRDEQWLGATVYSNPDGDVVACAPRYSEVDAARASTQKYYMIGKCVVLSDKFEDKTRLYPCSQQLRYDDGFCQAGFSATLKKEKRTLVMGAVMGKDQQGSVFEQESEDGTTFDRTNSDKTSGGLYLGYAVTYGKFYTLNAEDTAASATRLDFSGKVNIYKGDLKSLRQSLSPPNRVKQKQEYIYFGASICAVDVNHDGYSDLIVGAPFYSDKGGDEGRVYVYISSPIQSSPDDRVLRLSSGEDLPDPGLRGSNTKGARFGWSIANAGDLNNDEIEDFIVGAPQDQPDLDGDGFGNGAIYIYHGNTRGIFDNFQQKITAETLKGFYPNFRQFGYSVAGNLDTNSDEYPDIAVGAWQSDRIVLMRARPVMDVKAVMTLSRGDISVDNFTANCADNSGKQCLDVIVCFSYIGKTVSGLQELQYTFAMDAETSARGYKRVYRLENGKQVYEQTARFNLTSKNVSTCLNFSQIHVEDKDILTDGLSRGRTDIVFNLKYELISQPKCNIDTLCPVLDRSKDPSVSKRATIVLNCSDNICDYNLQVKINGELVNYQLVNPNDKGYERHNIACTIRLLDKSEIVIGKTENLVAAIELGNVDEVTYNPEVVIYHDASLQFEKINFDKSFRIEKQPVPSENATTSEIFRIQGPIERNNKVTFKLHYSTRNVLGNRRELSINVKASATAGQEKDNRDNNDTASVSVKREVLMEITGTSNPKLLNYPATAPALNIQNNNFSAVNLSNVGPNVTVTFELKNQGQSTLESFEMAITYPFKVHEPKEHEYIVYPVSVRTSDHGVCNTNGVLNPANTITSNEKSRRRRDAKELFPRYTSPKSFTCNVKELRKDDRFSVVFEFRLWTPSLTRYYAKDLLVKIEASAEYVDSLSTDEEKRKIRAFGSVDIQVSPQNPPGKSKSTPVWIIIVAVLGGILLLALAILALFKLGFFNRNRPPRDISAPQTDDGPPPEA